MPDGPEEEKSARIVRFPQSRVPGRGKNHPVRNLGLTKLAQALDPDGKGATGHWCSRCEGVWYGYRSEVVCPVCGSRAG